MTPLRFSWFISIVFHTELHDLEAYWSVVVFFQLNPNELPEETLSFCMNLAI